MLELTAGQLKAFFAEHPDAVLLDVRERWEVALASVRLPGVASLDIPMNEIPSRLDEVPSMQPVVCLCHHGARSAQVVTFLMRHDRPFVYNLVGGIDAWTTEVDPEVPRY